MLPTFSPVARSHNLRLESNELEAQAEIIKITVLWDVTTHRLVDSYQHFREKCCNHFLFTRKMEATRCSKTFVTTYRLFAVNSRTVIFLVTTIRTNKFTLKA
jgi:hypothetical protein